MSASRAVIQSGDTLVIHPGALGDLLLAIPALRSLRSLDRRQHLVLAAQPRLGHLLVALGLVDSAIDFESLGLGTLFTPEPDRVPWAKLTAAGRVVCWFGSRDPIFVANLRALAPGAVIAAPAGSEVPVWQHLCRTVDSPFDGLTETVAVPDVAREAGRQALADAGWDRVTPFVLVHPGAGGTAKRWPTEGFAAVAGALPQVFRAGRARGRRACHARSGGCLPTDTAEVTSAPVVVVHQGPADADAAAELVAALARDAIVLAEPPLTALAGALTAAALYVGNDSGVSHLAAAVGAPSVLLYTRRLLPWCPWAPEARVVEVSTGELITVDVQAVTDAAREALA